MPQLICQFPMERPRFKWGQTRLAEMDMANKIKVFKEEIGRFPIGEQSAQVIVDREPAYPPRKGKGLRAGVTEIGAVNRRVCLQCR